MLADCLSLRLALSDAAARQMGSLGSSIGRPSRLRLVVDRGNVSALQVVDRDLAMRVTALEIFSGFDRDLLDVAIAARPAVDHDFELRAAFIFSAAIVAAIPFRRMSSQDRNPNKS
jgi:hypothetical protein